MTALTPKRVARLEAQLQGIEERIAADPGADGGFWIKERQKLRWQLGLDSLPELKRTRHLVQMYELLDGRERALAMPEEQRGADEWWAVHQGPQMVDWHRGRLGIREGEPDPPRPTLLQILRWRADERTARDLRDGQAQGDESETP